MVTRVKMAEGRFGNVVSAEKRTYTIFNFLQTVQFCTRS